MLESVVVTVRVSALSEILLIVRGIASLFTSVNWNIDDHISERTRSLTVNALEQL